MGAPVPPAEQPDREAASARAQRKLGQRACASRRGQGRTWDLDRAVDIALEAIEAGQRARPRRADAGPRPILTSRELAVLELVVRGHTNREIAGELYISPSTAGVHVSNILRKLGAKRRVDAAGWRTSSGCWRSAERAQYGAAGSSWVLVQVSPCPGPCRQAHR